jgi:hypothetical protein
VAKTKEYKHTVSIYKLSLAINSSNSFCLLYLVVENKMFHCVFGKILSIHVYFLIKWKTTQLFALIEN